MASITQEHSSAPGTELLIDQDNSDAIQHYQHVAHGDSHLLLVPQPSLADPNDPLLWPRWKKWTVFGNGLFYSFNGGVTGPMMAGGMIGLSTFFQRPLADIAYSNGATLICQGFAIASEKTFPVLVCARAFLGLFEAPIEAIVPSTIADIFFLHERGEMIALYGLSVLGGNELGPLFSAYIIEYLSLRWAFFIIAISIGVSLALMIFLMPETMFEGHRPIIVSVPNHDFKKEEGEKHSSEHIETEERVSEESLTVTKRTYMQDLFRVTVNKEVSYWTLFKRPFILMAYPTVLWSSLVYGMSLSWNVILGVMIAQLFSPPPYNFTSGSQGLVFISPLIGSLVGTYLCGPLADQIATWFTARNNGVREPEMRLPTCIMAAFLTFVGALISGLTYNFKTHWAGPIVGFGVLSAGAQMGATLAISYSLDCHKELSAEIMVTISCLKSLVAWIWTWCINDWVAASGILTVFMVIATVNVLVYGTTMIFHFYGKSIRIWIHKRNFMGHA
ncbi:hypothetical protein N7451_007177 [Penicillium sp. IBT 35674x]|nr:hypothetical protein N7451_007177 [Penicillium sp. IBT 35674x]